MKTADYFLSEGKIKDGRLRIAHCAACRRGIGKIYRVSFTVRYRKYRGSPSVDSCRHLSCILRKFVR